LFNGCGRFVWGEGGIGLFGHDGDINRGVVGYGGGDVRRGCGLMEPRSGIIIVVK